MKNCMHLNWMAMVLLCSQALPVLANDYPVVIREFLNESPDFHIVLRTEKPTHRYCLGETFKLWLKPDQDCYIHLIHMGPSGKLNLLYPNDIERVNFIKAHEQVSIPGEKSDFDLVARGPVGVELLAVIATQKPLNLRTDKGKLDKVLQMLASDLKTQRQAALKDFLVEAKRDNSWVGNYLLLETFDPAAPVSPPSSSQPPEQLNPPVPNVSGSGEKQPEQGNATSPRRLFAGVAVSRYEDRYIPNLHTAVRDVDAVEKSLTTLGGFQTIARLNDKQATTTAFRRLLFETLRAETKPGDVLFLMYSGHGCQLDDNDADEDDGTDEGFVLYDSHKGNQTSVLRDDELDDAFSMLPGRTIIVMLDTCFSGDAHKGLDGKSVLIVPIKSSEPFDDWVNEFRDTKTADAADVIVLAASTSQQQAYEMPDHELSVMTHFFVKTMNEKANHTLAEMFSDIKKNVRDFVARKLGREQTPQLHGRGAESFQIRQ